MAPSTALLLLLLGITVFFNARTPTSQGAYLTGMAIATASALVAFLLLILSSLGIYSDAEHFGIPIAGSVDGAPIAHMSPVTALCLVLASLSLAASLASLRNPSKRRAMAAFGLACLVMFFITIVLLGYLYGTPLLYGGGFIPPALTTSVAIALLGTALLAVAGPRAWAPEDKDEEAEENVSRALIYVFGLVAAGIVATGYLYFSSNKEQYQQEVERQLSAVAQLKVGELARWRAELLNNATAFFGSPNTSALARRTLLNPQDAHSRNELQDRMRHFQKSYKYGSVLLADAQGAVRISIPDKSSQPDLPAHAREGLRSNQIDFVDFHQGEPGRPPHFSILIPVPGEQDGSQPLGLFVVEIDPNEYLDQFLYYWPTTSSTAETLLVRREGNEAVILNELKRPKAPALSMRFPLTRAELPAVRAVLGPEGIVRGVDHYGQAVIADVRAIPNSPWFLVAKIDTAEALAPVSGKLWMVASFIGILLVTAGALVALVWRHQRARYFRMRFHAANVLSASTERYRAVAEAAAEAIIIADTEGVIKGWNPAAERMFGYTEAEVDGQPLTLLMPHRYHDRHLAGMKRIRAGGEQRQIGKTLELHGLTKAGREFPLELSLSEWATSDGRFFAGILRDNTERKQAEAARASLEAQLRESQKMEALGTLAGGVAHDFNNALAIILGNVELARQDVGPGHAALGSLTEIGKASRRAKDLIQQILTFSRRQNVERKPTSLALMVVESARLLRATIPVGVSLSVDCRADTPAVLADATQVEQILLNLFGNALHAIQDQERPGRIEIRLEPHTQSEARGELRPGRYACLTVLDNGSGMDEAMRARVFEPFFTTKPVGKGTGLGLSVVHGIVHAHEASIEVESTPGKGSEFRIYFPAVEAPVAEVAAPAPDATPVHGNGKHVLYVDDEEAIIMLMEHLLERKSFRVSGYTDPREALAAARANPDQFDLVVTDYNMPYMSGLEVAHALKEIRADLPVLLASGYITEELRAQAPAAGIRELIYKPNTVDELCEAVVRYANAQSGNQGAS
jgi:PAS domain S-box-containing protein